MYVGKITTSILRYNAKGKHTGPAAVKARNDAEIQQETPR